MFIWFCDAVGSIPFGLVHLIDKLVGKEVLAVRVIGLILAGLLLSLLYLHYGLWAAIGCHWIWNVFSDNLVKSMAVGLNWICQILRGQFLHSLPTSIVLLIMIAALVVIDRLRQKSSGPLTLPLQSDV